MKPWLAGDLAQILSTFPPETLVTVDDADTGQLLAVRDVRAVDDKDRPALETALVLETVGYLQDLGREAQIAHAVENDAPHLNGAVAHVTPSRYPVAVPPVFTREQVIDLSFGETTFDGWRVVVDELTGTTKYRANRRLVVSHPNSPALYAVPYGLHPDEGVIETGSAYAVKPVMKVAYERIVSSPPAAPESAAR